MDVWQRLLRLASLALRHRRLGPDVPGESRLYAHGDRRLEAHLARRPDGRLAVLAVPVDGSRHSLVYAVGEQRPWHDFERQAGLRLAAWGPCRDASAGL